MKTLSVSLYNRVRYTNTVLSYLNECFDIDNYQILIFCEPTNDEVISIAKNFRPHQTTVTINSKKLGCNKNIYQCWEAGFGLNDFHIHLEDDTVPGKDFLIYCEWARENFKFHDDIFSISGYNNANNTHMPQSVSVTNNYNLISSRNWFTPWGWATWKSRWQTIKEGFENSLNTKTSWDCFVHKRLNKKLEIFPMVARIQNIGATQGTYCPSPEWHRKNQFNEYWIETSKQYQLNFIENQNYHE